MYYAITKFILASECATIYDGRDMHALIEKIRRKFKVTVKAASAYKKHNEPAIVTASLAVSESALNNEINSIFDFIENSGFGRISTTTAIVDLVDDSDLSKWEV